MTEESHLQSMWCLLVSWSILIGSCSLYYLKCSGMIAYYFTYHMLVNYAVSDIAFQLQDFLLCFWSSYYRIGVVYVCHYISMFWCLRKSLEMIGKLMGTNTYFLQCQKDCILKASSQIFSERKKHKQYNSNALSKLVIFFKYTILHIFFKCFNNCKIMLPIIKMHTSQES